ncbi:MAG TPA: hypothetical protein VFA27_12025 [Vicinamibacterales bacterium]|nr:hypothetical protein [Vicinamibacterales bacterium]
MTDPFGPVAWNEDDVQHLIVLHPDLLERVRLQREHWLRWLSKHHRYEFNKLRDLVAHGCEEDRLVFYLYNLKFYAGTGRLSSGKFRGMIKDLARTVDDLRVLRNSVIGLAVADATASNMGLQPWDDIREDLIELAEEILLYESWVGRKANALLDDAKAAIVRHVRERTRQHYHDEVAALIRAALEQEDEAKGRNRKIKKIADERAYTEKAHNMWVGRHTRLLSGETRHEAKWQELKATATNLSRKHT